jgi:nucleotide-binding universal stress UspA family protein
MYQKILLAYDGSTCSAAALKQGAELAAICKAELHLLSIASTSGGMAIGEAAGSKDVLGQMEHELAHLVADTVKALREQHIEVVATIREGDPASEIAAYARQIRADLLVLGHTQRGVFSRWLEGSVGARLLAHLPCSLLVATSGD